MGQTALEVEKLEVAYPRDAFGHRWTTVVKDVSFSLAKGTTFAIVGESGSGKTSIANAILGTVPIRSGQITLAGTRIDGIPLRKRRTFGHKLQVVFQDPYGSLSPTQRVRATVREALVALPHGRRSEADDLVTESLERVGLSAKDGERYPAEFSGGQRQRIAIARALIVQPDVLVCDEPVSALDVSVQAQVVNLLVRLQEELGLSYIFTSHDMSVVRHVAHRIGVMLGGRMLESGPAEQVTTWPAHPYTRALMASVPSIDPDEQIVNRSRLRAGELEQGDIELGEGCPFSGRCPYAIEVCRHEAPEPEVLSTGVVVACHRIGELPSGIDQ
jgi:oligopeptide/dipeptide ABC transporter ATP-binding protein